MSRGGLKDSLKWSFGVREAEQGADFGPSQQPGMSLKNRAGESTSLDSLEDPHPSDAAFRASGVQARAERTPSVPPIVSTQPALPLVSIGSHADPALLEPTYAYLSAYSFACLAPLVAQRLNVAVYELYANALRYGAPGGEVRLEIHRTARGARLSVSNRSEPRHLERVKSQIARVQEDPEVAFSGEMNRFAGASVPPPMLGIVRVAHECALLLEISVDGDRVEISTSCEG